MKFNVFLLFFLASLFLKAQIDIFSNFEGGNIQIISLDTNKIVFTPKQDSTQRQNVWFYFAAANVNGKNLILVEKNYRRQFLSYSFAYSYDKKHWFKTRNYIDNEISATKIFVEKDTLYVACCIPYLYSDLLKFINRIKQLPNIQIDTLTFSEKKIWIPLIIIKNKKKSPKKMVWIIARQHAFESASSFVIESFILEIAKNKSLLNSYTFYIVPMMDVDNVFYGKNGRGQLPVDFNRDWKNKPYWNAVKAVIDSIYNLSKFYDLEIFTDIHTVYPISSETNFYFGNVYPTEANAHFEELIIFWSIFNQISDFSIKKYDFKFDENTFYADQFYSGLYKKHNFAKAVEAKKFAQTIELSLNYKSNGKQWLIKDYKKLGKDLAKTFYLYLKK